MNLNDLKYEQEKEEAGLKTNELCASCKHMYPDRDIDIIYPMCSKTQEDCPEHEKDCCLIRNNRESLTQIEYEVYELIIFFIKDEFRIPTQKELAYEFDRTQGWAWNILHKLKDKGYIHINKKSRGIKLIDYKIRLERYDGVMI